MSVGAKSDELRGQNFAVAGAMHTLPADFSEKNSMPTIKLDNQCNDIIKNYSWPGNIRQLKKCSGTNFSY